MLSITFVFLSLFKQVMVVSEMSKDLEIPNCPSCVFTEWMWAEQGQDFGSTEDVRSLGPAPVSLHRFFGSRVAWQSKAGTAGGAHFSRLWVRKSPWVSAACRQYVGHLALKTEEGQAESKQRA